MNTALLLMVIALIILIGYLSDSLFKVTRVPEILILMFIGILIGPVGHFIPTQYLDIMRNFVPLFGTIALIMIMFDGGRKINIGNLIKSSSLGLLLGTLDILFSMIALSLIMNLIFHWPYIYGALLGTIIGETTAVVIVPVATRIKLPEDLYNISVTEATFNSVVDILIFYLLIIFLSGENFSLYSYSKYVIDYLSVAIFIGIITGFLWLFILNVLKSSRAYVATIGIAFLLYGIVDYFNGAAIISVFIFAIIIGSYRTIAEHLKLSIDIHEKEMNTIEEELEFLIRTFFFVFMGIIFIISFTYLIYAILITVILILIRLGEVRVVVKEKGYRPFLYSLFPRGLTVAVLGSILYSMGGTYFNDIFYISFMLIIITNILSAILISVTSKDFDVKK